MTDGGAGDTPHPPRVVYVGHVARLSGGEIALSRTLPALAGKVHARVVLAEEGPLADRLRQAGVDVDVLPMKASLRDTRKSEIRPGGLRLRQLRDTVSYAWRLSRHLRTVEADLVHTNTLKAALYAGLAGRIARVPVVWHIRDRIANDYLPGPAVRLVRLAARVLPSAVIANSEATMGTLPRLRGGNAVVVANAVVYDAVASPGFPHDQLARRPFRFALLGRLAPWKGQDVFLRAFAQAFPAGPVEAWLIGEAMFGESDFADTLRSLVEQLGIADRVVFRGFQADVWAELAHVDVLVHASVTPEPFGQVVLEGLAAGVPVIASAAGGPAEVLTSEVDGLLVAPNDADALAAAMRRLHDDPDLRRRLVSAGRVTVSAYSPERTAAAILGVYDQVLNRRGPDAR